MKDINIVDIYGCDLSSRSIGVKLRSDILSIFSSHGPVFINLRGVRTLSESFADEVFGILVEAKGTDWFRANIKLSHYSDEIRTSILSAIDSRLTAAC